MADNTNLGDENFGIPQQVAKDKHYSKAQLKAAQEMYSAIEYESGIDPDQYNSKGEITKEDKDKIIKLHQDIKEMKMSRRKADKKRGAGILNFLHSLAA